MVWFFGSAIFALEDIQRFSHREEGHVEVGLEIMDLIIFSPMSFPPTKHLIQTTAAVAAPSTPYPFPPSPTPRNNNRANRERNDHRVRINNHRIQNLNNPYIPPWKPTLAIVSSDVEISPRSIEEMARRRYLPYSRGNTSFAKACSSGSEDYSGRKRKSRIKYVWRGESTPNTRAMCNTCSPELNSKSKCMEAFWLM